MSNPELLICEACGTQFDEFEVSQKSSCRICDDPRQFVPPSGQSFTTLRKLWAGSYQNKWKQDDADSHIWSIWTEPKTLHNLMADKFGIGQRAMLLQTDHGNVLWDLIAFLDDDTISKISAMGGLCAIVISHPHFYTTYVEWAGAFRCPVYTSCEDRSWLHRVDASEVDRRFIGGPRETIVNGVTAIKTGGHFEGSLVLHWDEKLFIADSLMTVPSAHHHVDRLPGTSSYAFMWSIPNMIPLPPDKIQQIWEAVRPLNFTSTYGNMLGADIRDKHLKKRILESAKIQIVAEGYLEHELLTEELP